MNMDYCKFENTLGDLQQCADALADMHVERDEVTGKLMAYENEIEYDENGDEVCGADGPKSKRKLISATELRALRQLLTLCQELAAEHEDVLS